MNVDGFRCLIPDSDISGRRQLGSDSAGQDERRNKDELDNKGPKLLQRAARLGRLVNIPLYRVMCMCKRLINPLCFSSPLSFGVAPSPTRPWLT